MRQIVVIGTLIILFVTLHYVIDPNPPDCICSILTQREERYPITSLLNSIWDGDVSDTGIFIRVMTTCEHGKRIHVTIYPDQGYFSGYITR